MKERRISDALLKLIQFQDIGNVSFACLVQHNATDLSSFAILQNYRISVRDKLNINKKELLSQLLYILCNRVSCSNTNKISKHSPRNTRYIHKDGFDMCSNTFMSTYNRYRRSVETFVARSTLVHNLTNVEVVVGKQSRCSFLFIPWRFASETERQERYHGANATPERYSDRPSRKGSRHVPQRKLELLCQEATHEIPRGKKNILKTERANEQSRGPDV